MVAERSSTPAESVDPDDLERAELPTVFRGADQQVVHRLLHLAADEIRRLQGEIEVLREAATAGDAPAETLDEDTLTTRLGEEAAMVLTAAREAAAQVRTRAEEKVARLLREAQDEATETREHAERERAVALDEARTEADAIIAGAERIQHEAVGRVEAEIETARLRAQDLVAEAQTRRAEVLEDLESRQRVLLDEIAELDRMRSDAAALFDRVAEGLRRQSARLRGAESATAAMPPDAGAPRPPEPTGPAVVEPMPVAAPAAMPSAEPPDEASPPETSPPETSEVPPPPSSSPMSEPSEATADAEPAEAVRSAAASTSAAVADPELEPGEDSPDEDEAPATEAGSPIRVSKARRRRRGGDGLPRGDVSVFRVEPTDEIEIVRVVDDDGEATPASLPDTTATGPLGDPVEAPDVVIVTPEIAQRAGSTDVPEAVEVEVGDDASADRPGSETTDGPVIDMTEAVDLTDAVEAGEVGSEAIDLTDAVEAGEVGSESIDLTDAVEAGEVGSEAIDLTDAADAGEVGPEAIDLTDAVEAGEVGPEAIDLTDAADDAREESVEHESGQREPRAAESGPDGATGGPVIDLGEPAGDRAEPSGAAPAAGDDPHPRADGGVSGPIRRVPLLEPDDLPVRLSAGGPLDPQPGEYVLGSPDGAPAPSGGSPPEAATAVLAERTVDVGAVTEPEEPTFLDGIFSRLRAERTARTAAAREVLSSADPAVTSTAETEQPVIADDVESVAGADTDVDVDVDVEVEVEEVAHGSAPADEVASVTETDAEVEEMVVDEVEPEATAEPVEGAPVDAEVDDDAVDPSVAALFARRNELLADQSAELASRLKRALADQQNVVLDGLHHGQTVEELGPLVQAAFRSAVVDDLAATATAGSTLVGEAFVVDVDHLAHGLAEQLTSPLIRRLLAATDDGAGSGAATRVRSIFREWRSERIGPLAEGFVAAALAQGALAGAAPDAIVRWHCDPDFRCAEGADNELAGAVPRGEAFPTGHLLAPAYLGCRCFVVPVDPSA